MRCTIKPMSIADYDEVLHLWQNSDGVGLNESDTRKTVADYLKRNPGMSFVARDGTDLIGAVLCGHDGRRGYLHHLAVSPAYHRKGLGTRLVARCLEKLKRLHIVKCKSFSTTTTWMENNFGDATDGKNGRMFLWFKKISSRRGINVAVNASP